ncbi:MAG TPA: hypothetical protein EYN67_12410 [Flavobacteriales bacterium]|nr:hypothetical protein [Flavobacteriales bacterium]
MTITDVEQSCIKPQSIVYLLDVLEAGYLRKYKTAKQYKDTIEYKAITLTGCLSGKASKHLLSVIDDSYTTAEQYKVAIRNKMNELRSEINDMRNSKSNS